MWNREIIGRYVPYTDLLSVCIQGHKYTVTFHSYIIVKCYKWQTSGELIGSILLSWLYFLEASHQTMTGTKISQFKLSINIFAVFDWLIYHENKITNVIFTKCFWYSIHVVSEEVKRLEDKFLNTNMFMFDVKNYLATLDGTGFLFSFGMSVFFVFDRVFVCLVFVFVCLVFKARANEMWR